MSSASYISVIERYQGFKSAIPIALSIESLLLMLKAAVGEHQLLANAVYMMLATVGLPIGLGIYVYLGARAESTLQQMRQSKRPMHIEN